MYIPNRILHFYNLIPKMKEASHYAKILRDANSNKQSIEPLRDSIGLENIDFAYKIQGINTQYKLDNGAFITGKKIGLTSPAVQKQLGVDQPDFGILFNDMEILNGQSISVEELMFPKVESEIAFVLSQDLDSDQLSLLDIISAIDYALPALEIVGSRINNWNIKITDTVADNASASHYVLGHRPRTLDEFDVVQCKMSLSKNDEEVSSGSGSDCLGSPLNAVLWLAKKMAKLGNPLLEGEVILSGALGPMTNVAAGDHIRTHIEGLGSVSINFTK